MEKTKPIIQTGLVLLLYLSLTTCGGTGGNTPSSQYIGSGIKVVALMFNTEPTKMAYITVPYRSDYPTGGMLFMNVFMDINRDGNWVRYAYQDEYQEEWIVRNMPAKIRSAMPDSYSFEAVDSRFLSLLDIDTRMIITNTPLNEAQYVSGWNGVAPQEAVEAITIRIPSVEREDFGLIYTPVPGFFGGGMGAPTIPRKTAAVQSDVPNKLELVYEYCPPKRDKSQDLTQKHNECGPTSIANSLIWLRDQHPKGNSTRNWDKMPKESWTLIEELKKAMKWSEEVGIIATPEQFLSGKEAYVDTKKLPVITHKYVGNFSGDDFMAWVIEELGKNEQAIELAIEYRYKEKPEDKPSNVSGGHMVSLVCVKRWKDNEGKYVDGLGFHDPYRVGPSTDWYILDQNERNKVLKFGGDTTKDAYVVYAYAQSFVEDTTTTVPPIPSTSTTTTIPPITVSSTSTTTIPTVSSTTTVQPQPPSMLVSVDTTSITHTINVSPCPTPIGTMTILGSTVPERKPVNYAITNVPAWLSVSPASGTIGTGNPANVSLSFTCRGWSCGVNKAKITITVEDPATNLTSTDQIEVTVTVTGPPNCPE